MPKIKLYIAASIDGFIARKDGSLDWLESLPNPNQIDHGYTDFYNTIDTVIMGRATYEEILGFGVDWPYANSNSYVVTRQANYEVTTENTQVISQIDPERIEAIRRSSRKNIWIVGGGKIISDFLNMGLIDELQLSIAPIILGEGIPLFPSNPLETKFELVQSESFETGITNISYKRV